MQLKSNEIVAAVVIVAFIGVVLGVCLFPTLRSAPQQQCAANVKKVAEAIALYSSDQGGRLPLKDNWTQVLVPRYLDDFVPMACPVARPTQEQLASYQGEGKVSVPIGYAMPRFAAGTNAALFADPAKSPILFDSSEFGPNCVADISALAFRHVGKIANVAYADGHQGTLTAAPKLPKPFLLDKPAPPKPTAEGDSHEH